MTMTSRGKRRIASLLLACVCAVSFGQGQFVGSDIIVKYRPGVAQVHASPRAFAVSRGLRLRKPGKIPRTLVVDGGARPAALLARLQLDPDVEYVTRDRWIRLTSTLPNDPLFSTQYDLYNTGQNGGVPGADIQATAAWDVTTGSAAITIAISDTGCQIDHPDLASRIWMNPGEIAGNGLDDDSNGYVDDVNGWDFYSDTNTTIPSGGHGTSVLGIAGAAGNNGIGIAGTNWNSRMMPINGFAPSGFGTESVLVDGVVYAIDNGARVVNQSWGAYDVSPLMHDMALYAHANGALLVPASGNEGVDCEEYPFYPASLPYDSVLSVGGSEQRDDSVYNGVNGPRIFNYGVERVQIAAAAFAVPFTSWFSSYGSSHGTSYAAPIVSGAAGLVLSVAPGLSAPQLKYRLMGTAAQKVGLSDRNKTNGRLDAALAVSLSDAIAPGAITDLATQSVGWNGAVLRFTAPGGDAAAGRATFYQVRATTGPLTAANWHSLPYTPAHMRPQARGNTERILLNELRSGTSYNVAVRAVDSAGNEGAISNVLNIAVPLPATVMQDDCNTTHPSWTAVGFTLAPGLAHTGTLSWQDSPEADYAPSAVATLSAGPFNLASMSRPRLSFYLRRYFPMSQDRVDSLKVEASSDGGFTWKLLKRYHGAHAPFRREIVPLDEVAASGSTIFRFLTVADSNAIVSDGVYIDDIRLHEGAGGVTEARDIVMETIDFYAGGLLPPDYVTSGSWVSDVVAKSLAPKCEGFSSFRTPAGAVASGQFIPFLPQAGKYEVLATWSATETAMGVTYRVQHSGGQSLRVVNQLASTGHRWTSLGTYTFAYGRNAAAGSVVIDASTASGQNVRSDAIRLRYAELDGVSAVTAASNWQLFD
ncbi:MAG: S8 family serine peptidase [Candidatus Sumerlaeaceae bacterium]